MSAQEDPNASGTESEGFAPDEDFLEADADASTELGEAEEEGGEDYETDVEAPEEVRRPGIQTPALQPAAAAAAPPSHAARRRRRQQLRLPCSPARTLQVLDAAAREVARKERERLKQQDKLRREQLERMRLQQNQDASKGEVRTSSGAFVCLQAALRVAHTQLGKADACGGALPHLHASTGRRPGHHAHLPAATLPCPRCRRSAAAAASTSC